jgi:hypothetical protein
MTKARINLGPVAKRAYPTGEYFILEKDGIPIAGIMCAGEMEDYLELQNRQNHFTFFWKRGSFSPRDSVFSLRAVCEQPAGRGQRRPVF